MRHGFVGDNTNKGTEVKPKTKKLYIQSKMISLINEDDIHNFSERLKSILDNEIRLGNEISETAKEWPYKNGITVFLKHPFSQYYHCFPSIEYKEINDPHYWKSQYLDTDTNDLLTCGLV